MPARMPAKRASCVEFPRALAGLKELQGFAVDSGEIDQFDEVDPAFSGFGLGNEGLGAG